MDLAWAASSVPRPSCRRSCGRWGSCARRSDPLPCDLARARPRRWNEQLELASPIWRASLPALPDARAYGIAGPVAARVSAERSPAMVCRADGDRASVDGIRAERAGSEPAFRVHALKSDCARRVLPGDPGHHTWSAFAAGPLRQRACFAAKHLLEALDACETQHSGSRTISELPSRMVHLPLSWDDPATQLAIREIHAVGAAGCAVVSQQYRVHPPHQRARLRSTTCIASCSTPTIWCLGLGDVYLGAPVATPIDPRHRLVTTKYNPARTWTPENAVGIGGAYLCVYGMEGPGGYQFVGARCRCGTRSHRRRSFSRHAVAAALLRSDSLLSGDGGGTAGNSRCVSAREISAAHGDAAIPAAGVSRVSGVHRAASAADFKRRQQAAFDAERERWALAGADQFRIAARRMSHGAQAKLRCRRAAGRCGSRYGQRVEGRGASRAACGGRARS